MTSTSTSTPTSPDIGTLIVVVLKAKNLPNKRHIGKQDPYCTLRHGGETKRTKAIKRGGQHPEWDEELRFTILEDMEDEWAKLTETADSQPPPPPPKDKKKKRKIKGGMKMLVTCFADDPKEPVFIGETTVDLTEALTKGETDEWFTLTNKEKYCGEVYLELTFWSNERPPEKRSKRPSSTFSSQYGGPGSFTPSSDVGPLPANGGSPARVEGSSMSSLRTSSSIASVPLYQPPYERQSRYSDVDQLTNRVADLNFDPSRRRESFPPPTNGTVLSEFGYADSPSRINGAYNTLSSSGSISSVHSLHSSPSSLNLHHRNTLSTLPEGLVPRGDAHSPSTSKPPLRIPSTSIPPYHSSHSPNPSASGYDTPPIDNYNTPSSTILSYATSFPEPEIPAPSRTPVPYSYDITSPPLPVTSSGFITSQQTSSTFGYSPSIPQSTFAYPPQHPQTQYQSPPTPYQPSQTPYQLPQTPQTPFQSTPAPYQPSQTSYQPTQTSYPPPQTPQTPFQSTPTPFQPPPPPPPLNSYPIQTHGSPLQSSEGFGVEGNSSNLTTRLENSPSHTHTTPSPKPPPPPPVNAFQQLQGMAPQGSRPLPTPQVKSDNSGSSGFVVTSQSGTSFTTPGPPPPPPPPPRHRPTLPPTPSLTPSVSYPPPPSHLTNGTFNTPPPPPPPSQYLSHSSPSPIHYAQSSFSSHGYSEIPSSNGSSQQPYQYSTPPPPRTPTLPYQSPSHWHTPTPSYGPEYGAPPPEQNYSTSPPPPMMPMPNFYSNAPVAPPYGYPPQNQYGW